MLRPSTLVPVRARKSPSSQKIVSAPESLAINCGIAIIVDNAFGDDAPVSMFSKILTNPHHVFHAFEFSISCIFHFLQITFYQGERHLLREVSADFELHASKYDVHK